MNPNIGGTPSMTSESLFTSGVGSGAWQMDVWSYAFIGTAGPDPIPPSVPALPDPGAGQTLFMYVIRMTSDSGNFPASVNQFDVGNPIPVGTPTVGYDPTIVPDQGGAFTGNRQNPSSVLSSLDARSVSYFFDNANVLNPGLPQGEFSVLFFLANDLPGLVSGTVTGGAASFDEHLVLGPIPEPAVMGLLVLGALSLARRNRR